MDLSAIVRFNFHKICSNICIKDQSYIDKCYYGVRRSFFLKQREKYMCDIEGCENYELIIVQDEV